MHSATYGELLRGNRNFRSLWAGQVISELGTWFSAIAELGLMRLLSGSTMMTAALLVARTLPFLLVSPLAGVAVDRGRRKRILIAADLLRALLACGYLLTNVGAPVWTIIVITALMTSTGTFFEAAKNATIANVTTRQEMLTANVLMFGTRFLQLTLGAALGGLTAAKFGYNVAFIINALSFVASAWFIWRIPGEALQPPQAESEPETAVVPNKFWRDVREGLAYIWGLPFVRGIIMVNVGWATGGGMNNLLFDRLAGHEFAHGPGDRGDRDCLHPAKGAAHPFSGRLSAGPDRKGEGRGVFGRSNADGGVESQRGVDEDGRLSACMEERAFPGPKRLENSGRFASQRRRGEALVKHAGNG